MASELGVQTIQHTNGTDAIDIGSNGSTSLRIPSFMVESGDVDQAYSTSDDSLVVQFPTVKLDTESAWDSTNHRYTPGIAGWYTFSGAVRCKFTSNPEFIAIQIVKNSDEYDASGATSYVAQYQMTNGQFTNGTYPVSGAMIYLNGSTDYVNLSFRAQYSCTLSDSANLSSWFCGQLVKAGS